MRALTGRRRPGPRRAETIRIVAVALAGFVAALHSPAVAPVPAAAQTRGPRTVSATATLSILKGGVDRITAGGERVRASDGMTLAVGDRVRTSRNGLAVITFLDGSTVTVQPGSEVEARRTEVSAGRRADTSVLIVAGTAWARVARLLERDSRLSLQSNTATAAVHDGLIGAQQNPDASFECWTQRGELTVTDSRGQRLVTLEPGEATRVAAGRAAPPAPFFVMASTLRVVASPGVWPLLEMPYDRILAGFVAPGVEVNQVYGSRTAVNADGTREIEVPAGFPGPFTVIVEAREDGPFAVTVTGRFRGSEAYRLEFRGRASRGERLWTSVMQDVWETAGLSPGAYATGARALGAQAARFGPMRAPLPGWILLSPTEASPAGR